MPDVPYLTTEIVLDVNPEPWAIGTTFAGRTTAGIKSGVAPNQKLVTFQKALRDSYRLVHQGGVYQSTVPLCIEFYFWRQVETWTTPSGRGRVGNYADATNLQKATEDALQGLLLPNDRQNRSVYSEIVEQGPDVKSAIVIRHGEYKPNTLTISWLDRLIKDEQDRLAQTFRNEW